MIIPAVMAICTEHTASANSPDSTETRRTIAMSAQTIAVKKQAAESHPKVIATFCAVIAPSNDFASSTPQLFILTLALIILIATITHTHSTSDTTLSANAVGPARRPLS
jgi:hypothetical protein